MDKQLNIDFSIVNTDMAVRSMRDSGYKSTTHALAELVDNSIEAGATTIEIIGVSRVDSSTHRNTLQELAVLDNGNGMDEITLRRSLRYGDGTRSRRAGIGRFGLGLPNSSMSQARRVDVWSWRSGPPNALHTYLAIDDVEKGIKNVPEPTRRPLPAVYMEGSTRELGDSGTLVVWSDLDRVQWKRIATTFKHTEAFLGRVYRRFLAPQAERLHTNDPRSDEIGPRRTIVCVPVDDHDGRIETSSKDIVEVRPNDPLYLMTTTSCPSDFGDGPMFQEYEGSPFAVPVTVNGIQYQVRVRASYVRAEARDSDHERASWPEQFRGGLDAGNTPWGRHAGTNTGISVVRAHRELDIDESWTNRYNPTERWWKIEVDFPTALDELFGVTNNKQGTMTFQRLAHFDWRKELVDGEASYGDVRRRMEREGDPRVGLLELHKLINNTIRVLRVRVKQSRRKRTRAKQEESTNAKVTAVIKRRQSDGYGARSKVLGDQLPTKDEKRDVQRDLLVTKYKYTEDDALRLIEENFRTGHLVRWLVTEQQTSAFFDVDFLPHVLEVALNAKHPVHKYLYEILDSGETDLERLEEVELRERLAKASVAFQILIYAWARYEDEQPEKVRERLMDTRVEWGKYAREFFSEDDGEPPPTSLGD